MDCDMCGKCCVETSMQLSPQDISRLKKLGYNPAKFTARKGGFKTLKNVKGVCYFFDTKSSSCRVYAKRPEGCKYYPIVYSLDEGRPVIDEEVCPEASTITAKELEKTAPKLAKLVGELMKNCRS